MFNMTTVSAKPRMLTISSWQLRSIKNLTKRKHILLSVARTSLAAGTPPGSSPAPCPWTSPRIAGEMKTHLIPKGLRDLLLRSVAHRHYSLLVMAIAFATTITFSFPFIAVLVPAVLLSPGRWRTLGLLSGLASGCGAAVLVEIFQSLGSEVVLARYPELARTEAWQFTSEWLQRWGLVAMLIIAGSPMPQTPALLLCALANVSTPGILVAVGLGKTVKYLCLSWATARYPARFIRYN